MSTIINIKFYRSITNNFKNLFFYYGLLSGLLILFNLTVYSKIIHKNLIINKTKTPDIDYLHSIAFKK